MYYYPHGIDKFKTNGCTSLKEFYFIRGESNGKEPGDIHLISKDRQAYEPVKNNIGIVAALILIVVDKHNHYLLTLHDRSFSGARSLNDKYALLTTFFEDEDWAGETRIKADTICRNAIKRNLRQVHELNLDSETVELITDDTDMEFSHCFENAKENSTLFSFLYATKITPDIFATINKRGNYLLALSRHEYSKLHRLGLLGDIIENHSCEQCPREENRTTTPKDCPFCKPKGSGRSDVMSHTCILNRTFSLNGFKDITERNIDVEHSEFKNHPLKKSRLKSKCNATIIKIDVSNYQEIDPDDLVLLKDTLYRMINEFLPNTGSKSGGNRIYKFDSSGVGVSLVLHEETSKDHCEKLWPSGSIALLLSIFLKLKIFELRSRISDSIKLNDSDTKYHFDVRIVLHADDLSEKSTLNVPYFSGSGEVDVQQMIGFCQDGQILCSMQFLMQILSEFVALNVEAGLYNEKGRDAKQEWFTVNANIAEKENGNLIRMSFENDQSEHSDDALKLTLETLLTEFFQLPISAVHALLQESEMILNGMLFMDLGYYSDEMNKRHRLFNVMVTDAPNVLSYGTNPNPIQFNLLSDNIKIGSPVTPTMHANLKLRSDRNTEDTINNLMTSLNFVKEITCYGYSNIRFLTRLYDAFRHKDKDVNITACINWETFVRAIAKLNIIFYRFNEIVHIKQQKNEHIARIEWIVGLLTACQLKNIFGKIKNKNHDIVRINICKIRHGYNFFKAIYNNNASSKHHDHIRFMLPVPGHNFENAPIYRIQRGHPLFNSYVSTFEESLSPSGAFAKYNFHIEKFLPFAFGEEVLSSDEYFLLVDSITIDSKTGESKKQKDIRRQGNVRRLAGNQRNQEIEKIAAKFMEYLYTHLGVSDDLEKNKEDFLKYVAAFFIYIGYIENYPEKDTSILTYMEDADPPKIFEPFL